MAKVKVDIDELTEQQIRDRLKRLIEELDILDGEDFFGTEGWREFIPGCRELF